MSGKRGGGGGNPLICGLSLFSFLSTIEERKTWKRRKTRKSETIKSTNFRSNIKQTKKKTTATTNFPNFFPFPVGNEKWIFFCMISLHFHIFAASLWFADDISLFGIIIHFCFLRENLRYWWGHEKFLFSRFHALESPLSCISNSCSSDIQLV